MGEVFGLSLGQFSSVKGNYKNMFMYVGDIVQLVECCFCNWVVVFMGWMFNCLGGNDSIFYLNWWLIFFQEWKRGLEYVIEKFY